MELVDCDNVKVPVDYETIIDGLIELRETENLSPALEVNKIIAIINRSRISSNCINIQF